MLLTVAAGDLLSTISQAEAAVWGCSSELCKSTLKSPQELSASTGTAAVQTARVDKDN